jgi:type I restriction enzyme M protein
MEKLTAEQKQFIATRIAHLDKKQEIVTLTPNASFSSGTIVYNKDSGIVLHENISKLTDEEYVRAYLVIRLVKQLKYPTNALELEKSYTIGRPSPTRAQIDIKVLDKRQAKQPKTFMLIEAKRPDDFESYSKLIEDQLFATGNQEYANGCRYVIWYSVELSAADIRDKCIVIDLRKYHEHKAWIDAGELGHNLDLPIEYGIVRKHQYVKGETDLATDLTREDLTRMQKDFHNVLWGGAKMGDTEVFNNLLKMLLAKIYDEHTTEEGRPYRFQVEVKDGEPETPSEITLKVNRVYQEALRQYFRYDHDKLSTAVINENRFPPNKVAYVIERLEGVSITQNKFEDDVLGVFFEAIVRTGFKQEKGQFFTHANIVRFILHALELDEWAIELINGNPPLLPYIMDPACGSGTFIIEAMKMITHAVLHEKKDKLKKSRTVRDYVQEWFQPGAENKNIQNRWAREFIYGADDNEDLATAVKVNMILHGDGNSNIQKADGLAPFEKFTSPRLQISKHNQNSPYKLPANEQFDCIISNPPFSLKEEARTLAEYGNRFAYADRKNSENLFIERWFQLLKPGGRMGVVLPDSVFDTNENLYIRMFLYRFFWVRAVVSLPQVSFQPYTPTKTSLLFAVKKTRKEVESWDNAWREATRAYKKLRDAEVVSLLRTNDQLRHALIDVANKAEVEWYPSTNLLTTTTLSSDIRQLLINGCEDSATLKKKLASLLEEVDAFIGKNALGNIANANESAARTTLSRLLRDRQPHKASSLKFNQLLETTYDDIIAAADLNHTEDPKGQPYCNAWWCFSEVTSRKEFDCAIFFAEAEHVGYKRTTRHPEGIPQPNDLFLADADGNIIINTKNPRTILDHMRTRQNYA